MINQIQRQIVFQGSGSPYILHCIKRCWSINPNIESTFVFGCHTQINCTSIVLISTQVAKHGSINMHEMIARVTRNTMPLKHQYISIEHNITNMNKPEFRHIQTIKNPTYCQVSRVPLKSVPSVTRNSTSSM